MMVAQSVLRILGRLEKHGDLRCLIVKGGRLLLLPAEEAENALLCGKLKWGHVAGFYSGSVPPRWVEDDIEATGRQG